MSRKITWQELRGDCAAVLRAVAGGEVFVVTSDGTPIARLVPPRRRTFVPRADLVSFRADLDAFADQDLRGG